MTKQTKDSVRLHPDFPKMEPTTDAWRNWPDPLDDIEAALTAAPGDVSLADLEKVTYYYVSSDDGRWAPGGSVATELTLYLVARLTDGRWIALDAWNDYTGWGCQDGADLYVGTSEADVIDNGLTNDARSALGLALA